MSSKSAKDAALAVCEYLLTQNRPYSTVDIFNNLHKQLGKTAVQKALDQLVQDGKVREKLYGKQKIYLADQKNFPVVDEAEVREMEEKTVQLSANLKTTQEQLKETENKYSSLNAALTSDEMKKQTEEFVQRIEKLTNKLSSLKENNRDVVSPEEKRRIVKEREKFVAESKKRKRMATEMMDSILENYPSDKKSFCEEVGVELDEDVVPK